MGLLAHGRPRHGYELRQRLEEELGPEWRLDFGQLYRLLATMNRKGWVTATLQPGPHGPQRKVYALTRQGRAELRGWLGRPAGSERGRDEFALKLKLGLAARHRVDQMITERRRTLESQHQFQRTQRASAEQVRDVGRWMLADARLRRTEAALGSLVSCETLVRTRRNTLRSTPPAPLVAIGSDDPLLDLLARQLAEKHPEIHFSATPAGSLTGLLALREGRAQLAGIHLLDFDSGEYNVPFIKHLMPEEPVVLVTLAEREQGLMVAAGNPKGIRRVRDLTRRHVRLINRQRGAGTRLLLFHRLREAGIDPHAISNYGLEAPTHTAVAAAVAAGTVDVGPGIRAVAQTWGLDFIPLGFERYDLAIPRPVFESRQLRPLLETLHQPAFRRAAAAFTGYDLTRMSEVVAEVR